VDKKSIRMSKVGNRKVWMHVEPTIREVNGRLDDGKREAAEPIKSWSVISRRVRSRWLRDETKSCNKSE
jgi:hypothetical protein